MIFKRTSQIQLATMEILPDESNFAGSGILLDSEGHIATCAHVVEGSKSGKLVIGGETTPSSKFNVIARGSSDGNDVAILNSTPNILDVINKLYDNFKLSNFVISREKISAGTMVAVCGYPSGVSYVENLESYLPTITIGVVSRKPEKKGPVLISAQILPGNSGGPCYTEFGKVIGIVSSRLAFSLKVLVPGGKKRNIEITRFYGQIFPMSTVKFLARKSSIKLGWKHT